MKNKIKYIKKEAIMKEYTLVISLDSCGEEENQFRYWLDDNLPDNYELQDEYGDSGIYDEDWNRVEQGEEGYIDFWYKYCNHLKI